MLSTTDLLTIQTMPSEKDVALQTIQMFYKEHLCQRLFTFHLDDTKRSIIKLRFEERHLCHLLGIQYCVDGRKKHDYAGQKGYELIENGTVTFDSLKKHNKNAFKSKKKRMLYFSFVHQIMQNPSVIEYTPHNQTSLLKLDVIFYNYVDNTYLHLGLDKDTDSDYYYPKSFFDRKKNDRIVGNNQIPILKTEIVLD